MKIAVFLALLFVTVFCLTVLSTGLLSGGGARGYARVEILPGENVRGIAKDLKSAGVIRSEMAFRWYIRHKGLDRNLHSGVYVISRGSSYSDIVDAFSREKHAVVTIPEGYTISQIDALIARMGLADEGEITKCARECDFSRFGFLHKPDRAVKSAPVEGYLFPDTYYVNAEDFNARDFLGRMLGTFQKKVVEGVASDIRSSNRRLSEIVIMASLIEREAGSDGERPVIAGILWKRLDSGRGLAVDATLRYAINKATGALGKDDLDVDSAYNTRKYRGLPPGAISNPGIGSIMAAIHPKESPYWYYLHGRDGKIRYSETNDGHNANKAKYL